jgi:hypothetical protein
MISADSGDSDWAAAATEWLLDSDSNPEPVAGEPEAAARTRSLRISPRVRLRTPSWNSIPASRSQARSDFSFQLESIIPGPVRQWDFDSDIISDCQCHGSGIVLVP